MELRQLLTMALDDYLSAIQSLDEAGIRDAKSESSMAEMENLFAMMGRELASGFEMLREDASSLPDFSNPQSQVLETGSTAGLFLARPSTDSPGLTECHLARFVDENGRWKLEKTFCVYTEGHNAGDVTYQDVEDEFPEDLRIGGQSKPVPEPVKPLQNHAVLDVMAYGYEVHITLDDKQYPPVSDGSSSRGLEGGLDDGEHRIAITAAPIGGSSSLRVSIRAAGDDDAERCVFEWGPSGDDPLEVDTRFQV